MTHRALAIESKPGNFIVLARFLAKMNIEAVHVKTPGEVEAQACGFEPVAVAIIDLSGFGDAIWDCCKLLRQKGIPMLIISHGGDKKAYEAGFEHGAKGVFKKPVMMRELAGYIKALINKG